MYQNDYFSPPLVGQESERELESTEALLSDNSQELEAASFDQKLLDHPGAPDIGLSLSLHRAIEDDVTEIETDTGLQLAAQEPRNPTVSPPVNSTLLTPRKVRKRPVITNGSTIKGKQSKSKIARLVSTGIDVVLPSRRSDSGERPFQLSWLLEYEWLRYDPDRKKMFCSWCAEYGKKNAFGKPAGTNNFRKSNCDEHMKSKDHRDASVTKSRTPGFQENFPNTASVAVTVITTRGPDGSTLYQGSNTGNSVTHANTSATGNSDVHFHAKKASMLLSGFLCQHNLPSSLSKEFMEIMPFMFPDSAIAAGLAKLNTG